MDTEAPKERRWDFIDDISAADGNVDAAAHLVFVKQSLRRNDLTSTRFRFTSQYGINAIRH